MKNRIEGCGLRVAGYRGGFRAAMILLLVSTAIRPAARAEEIGEVLGLGGAGVALTGRPEAYLSNPAHLSGLDRWMIGTGFVSGTGSESRPGVNAENRPSAFWASLSEVSLLVPLPGDVGLAGFVSRVGGASLFRTIYQTDVPAGPQTIQNTGDITDYRSGSWFRGVAAGKRIGLDLGVGVALGHLAIHSQAFRGLEYFTKDYPGVGFVNTTSQTFEEEQKAGTFGGVLGGTYRVRKDLQAGASFTFLAPAKIKESYRSFYASDSEPDHPFDQTRILEGESTLDMNFPLTASVGAEYEPKDFVKFVIQAKIKTSSSEGRMSWVERSEAGLEVLNGIPWTAEKALSLEGGLGAEYLAGRWGFRLGLRNIASPSPKITGDLEEQDEHVVGRALSLGLGFRNPFLVWDLGYAYGWGRGDAKSVQYADWPSPAAQIQSVTLIPISRRELHHIQMGFTYLF